MKAVTRKRRGTRYTPDGLTAQERSFVRHYVLGSGGKQAGNATQAAVDSYNCVDRDSARAIGTDVLARSHVQDAIATLRAQVDYSAEDCLAEIDDALQLARGRSNVAGIASLLTLKARIKGLIIDKAQVHQVVEHRAIRTIDRRAQEILTELDIPIDAIN